MNCPNHLQLKKVIRFIDKGIQKFILISALDYKKYVTDKKYIYELMKKYEVIIDDGILLHGNPSIIAFASAKCLHNPNILLKNKLNNRLMDKLCNS